MYLAHRQLFVNISYYRVNIACFEGSSHLKVFIYCLDIVAILSCLPLIPKE